jgi:chorismate mutase
MKLELTEIAARLEGLEETIIAKLIDRAQFRENSIIYQPGRSGFKNARRKSLFALRLFFQETMDARFGRFQVPEERPFNKNLPAPHRKVHLPPCGLQLDDYDQVNLTAEIRASYLRLLPALCRAGDDGQYGSSVEHDVYALQALARRIHYGAMYVAECKFQEESDTYRSLLATADKKALLDKLTRKEVEEKILRRIAEKVRAFQVKANPAVRILVEPEVLTAYYQSTIIPLTKEGEVRYLLKRGRK